MALLMAAAAGAFIPAVRNDGESNLSTILVAVFSLSWVQIVTRFPFAALTNRFLSPCGVLSRRV